MSARPKMLSIWDELFPSDADHCDSNIVEVLVDSKPLDEGNSPVGRVVMLEIFVDIFPFATNDTQGATIHKKITARGAYVFDRATKDLIVGQMLKDLRVYTDIVRFDVITTGSLFRFECDGYTIETLP